MKVLYLDCFSGISGDMTLGAFIDLGVDPKQLAAELDKLDLPDFHLEWQKTKKQEVAGVKADVIIDKVQHAHRHYSTIQQIIMQSDLSDEVKHTSLAIFDRIAKAEAKVHEVSIEKVHFHEVGAVDSIADIVGAAICYHLISPDAVYVSPINVGSGFVKCDHGMLPVPAPATAEIIADSDLVVYARGDGGELTTPTGAAIAAELATPLAELPKMKVITQGYGFGTKELKTLNALRIYQGELEDDNTDDVWMIETNIDDMTGEVAGYVLEGLLELGVRDAYYTPVYMKKNRPGILLSVLTEGRLMEKVNAYLFAQTSTIGLRRYPLTKTTMERSVKTIATPDGDVRFKVCRYGGVEKSTPEYEDLRKIAKKTGKPLRELMCWASKEI